MTPETPRDAGTRREGGILPSTPLDTERLIPIWVKSLASEQRSAVLAATEGLVTFVCSRLAAISAYVDHSSAVGKPLFPGATPEIRKSLQEALFQGIASPCDTREFFEQAAIVMREWLITHLEKRLAASEPAGSNPSSDTSSLLGWCEFHREAGNLPIEIQPVHDLMYYSHLTASRTAEILGRPIEIIEKDKDVAVRLLRPFFDKGRGKK